MNTRLLMVAISLCFSSSHSMNNENLSINIQKKQALEKKLAIAVEACKIQSGNLQDSHHAVQRKLKTMNKLGIKTYLNEIQDYLTTKNEYDAISASHEKSLQTIELLDKQLCDIERSIANTSIFNIKNYPMNSLQALAVLFMFAGTWYIQKVFPDDSIGNLATCYVCTIGFWLFGTLFFEVLKTCMLSEAAEA